MKPVASLSVSIKPSRRLLVIQSVAHAVAVGAVLAATLPSWLAALFLLLIGASLAHVRRTSAVESLVLSGDGRLQAVGADGKASEAVVHPHTLVLSFLVVLLYRQEDRLRCLTLLADSLAVEEFRQLRLWLRWRSTVATPA
ncbi:MAG: protein YgfX [Sulfuritalea sp.]|nr:protein YgfX [Sulfuritalea sp.]